MGQSHCKSCGLKKTKSSLGSSCKNANCEQVMNHKRRNFYCSICLREFSRTHIITLTGCSEQFCESCIKSYCEVQCQDGVDTIKCPDKVCESALTTAEIELAIGRKAFVKYTDRLAQKLADSSPQTVYCPSRRCSLPMEREDLTCHQFNCLKCDISFCADCKVEWHTGVSCEQYKAGDIGYSNWRAVHDVRQCPKCQHDIERIAGCDQMICTVCRTLFNWRSAK